jgi:hypothetical protein
MGEDNFKGILSRLHCSLMSSTPTRRPMPAALALPPWPLPGLALTVALLGSTALLAALAVFKRINPRFVDYEAQLGLLGINKDY